MVISLRSGRVFLAAVLAAASVSAQTYYWNPSPVSATDGEINKTWNWTTGRAGTGERPPSSLDEDFSSAATVGTGFTAPGNAGSIWTNIDSVKDGNSLVAVANGKLEVTGRGADVWNSRNQFVAAYRKDITGSLLDVTVKVESQDSADPWSKAGILLFNDFNNPASGGAFAVIVTPGNGFAVHYDSGGAVGRMDAPIGGEGGKATFPCWLRAVRAGNLFSGYYRRSPDSPWVLIKQPYATRLPAANSQVGLFITSHNTARNTKTVFDDFRGGGALPADLALSFNSTGPRDNANSRLTGNLTAASIDFTSYGGVVDFGSATLSVKGNANFSGNTGFNLIPGTGSLALTGTTGTQTLTPRANDTLPPITKAGASALVLAGSPLIAASLNVSAGSLDFGGQNVTTVGNLQVTGGGPSTLINLAGRTLKVGGNASFAGSAGSLLGLNPASAWFINASGSLFADFATVANSNASGGSAGQATADCVNGGGNVNWNFGPGPTPEPPVITQQPAAVTVGTGQPATFRVSASGLKPMTYQWRRQGNTTVVGTDSVYTLASAAPADDGALFYCVVANKDGSATSADARLTVTPAPPDPPVITRQPADKAVRPGQPAVFSISAGGGKPLAYAWYKQGGTGVLSGDSLLTLSAPALADNGSLYYCIVTNKDGKDSSRLALLTVAEVCDSVFAASADTAVDEGTEVNLWGKADCSSAYQWNVDPGPAPAILDNMVLTLAFKAPRVPETTVLTYRFTATYGDSLVEKAVRVTVREAIPDPKISMAASVPWDGKRKLALRPAVANRAELDKHPAWPVAYEWSLAGPAVDTVLDADSLVLSNPRYDGLLDVQVCVGNGGGKACGRTEVAVNMNTVSLAALAGAKGPVARWERTLVWLAPARVRVLRWDGRVLFEAREAAGAFRELPAGAVRALGTGSARLEVTP